GLKDENGKPVTNWTDIDITVEPPVGTVSPAVETEEKGIYTATYTVGVEKAEVTIAIAAGEAEPVSLPPITLLAGLMVEGNVLEADGALLAPGVPAIAVVTHEVTGITQSGDVVNGQYSVIFTEAETNLMADGDKLIIEIRSVDGAILFGSDEHFLTQVEIDAGVLQADAITTDRVSDFTIKGMVTDAQGNPIENAVVSALSGETSTDANGEYALVLADYATNPVVGDVVEVSVTTDTFAVVQMRKQTITITAEMLQNRGVEGIDILITPVRIGGLTIDTSQLMNLIDKATTRAGVPIKIRDLVKTNPQYSKFINDLIGSLGPLGSLVPVYLVLAPTDESPRVFEQWQNADLENFGNPIVPYPLIGTEFLEALTKFEGNLPLRVVGNKLDLYLIAPEYADDISFESGLGVAQTERVSPGQTSITHSFQLEEEFALTQLPAWPGMTEESSFSVFSGVTLYYALAAIEAPESRDAYDSVPMQEQVIDGKVVWTASPELEMGKKCYYFFEVELKRPLTVLLGSEKREISKWVMPDPRNMQIEDRGLFSKLFRTAEWPPLFAPVAQSIIAGQPIPAEALPPLTDYLMAKGTEIIKDILDPTSVNYLDPQIVSEFKTPSVPAGESLWLTHFDVDARDSDYGITVDVKDADGNLIDHLDFQIGVDRRVAPTTLSISPGQNTLGYFNEEDNVHVFARAPEATTASTLVLQAPPGPDTIGMVFQVLREGQPVWSTNNSVLALLFALAQHVDPELAESIAKSAEVYGISSEQLKELARQLNEAEPAIQALYNSLDPASKADLQLILEVLGQISTDPTNLAPLQRLLNVKNISALATLATKFANLSVSPISFFDRNQIMLLPGLGDYWVRV
ncbi:MAG: hypothetical protein ACE5PV_22415, partial [Candidatus Poribacteria bacterium]